MTSMKLNPDDAVGLPVRANLNDYFTHQQPVIPTEKFFQEPYARAHRERQKEVISLEARMGVPPTAKSKMIVVDQGTVHEHWLPQPESGPSYTKKSAAERNREMGVKTTELRPDQLKRLELAVKQGHIPGDHVAAALAPQLGVTHIGDMEMGAYEVLQWLAYHELVRQKKILELPR